MKKSIIAVFALFTLSFSLASCKKDYTCVCNKTRTSNGATLTTHDQDYTFKDTRTKAESRCNAEESTGSDAAGDYSINCDIK